MQMIRPFLSSEDFRRNYMYLILIRTKSMKVDDKDPYNKKGKKSKISEKEKYYGCLSFNHHQTTRPRSNLVAYIVDL